jgi:osmotically-inducible protein OsmY
MRLVPQWSVAPAALLASVTLITGCSTSPPKSPEQAQADEVAAQKIYEALDADPTYYFRHVDVHVYDGVAELRGYIWGTQALYRAKEIAAGVPGVRRVVNDMELEREGSQGGASHEGGG